MNKNLIDYLLISELSKDYLPRMPIGDVFHYETRGRFSCLQNIALKLQEVL